MAIRFYKFRLCQARLTEGSVVDSDKIAVEIKFDFKQVGQFHLIATCIARDAVDSQRSGAT